MSNQPYTVDPLIFQNTFSYTITRFPSLIPHQTIPQIIASEA